MFGWRKKKIEEINKADKKLGSLPIPIDFIIPTTGDMYSIPIHSFPLKMIYDLSHQCSTVETIVRAITDETFRNGLYFQERFKTKCVKCGAEFEENIDFCTECGSITRKPDLTEKKRFKKWFESFRNSYDENLITVLKQIDDDVNRLDNGFLMLRKEYYYTKDGKLFGFKVKDIVRASPFKMKLLVSKYGIGRDKEGNYLYVCPEHRDELIKKQKEGIYFCDKCGKQLLPAWYGSNDKGKKLYYAKDEVYLIKRWSQTQGYGLSPLISVATKILLLLKMERFMLVAYSLQRSPKGLLVIRGRIDSVIRAWEELMQKAMEHPNSIYPLVVEGGDTSKRVVEYIDFSLKPEEMQWTDMRNELRKQIGCYTPDVEMLVRGKGWVKKDDIEVGDYVFAFDKNTGEGRWERVQNKYEYKYDGVMYHLKSRKYDLIVSPEHRILYYTENSFFGGKLKPIEKRIGYTGSVRGIYPMASREWKGNEWEGETFVVSRDNHKLHIDGINLAKLVGWYVSEGYRSKDKYYKVCITQSKSANPDKFESIKHLLEDIGLNYYVHDNHICINSKEISEWLGKNFGDGALNKHLPQWFKDLDRKYLEAFLETFIDGDGNRRVYVKQEHFRLYTSSEKLRDDLQEILIKLGYSTSYYVWIYKGHKHKIEGREVETTHDVYEIVAYQNNKGEKKWYTNIRMKHLSKINYSGIIWDVDIGGGYVFVRRNGKVMVSGNSRFGVQPLFQGDLSIGTGLNNEGLQITVTNRTIATSQSVWNRVLDWLSYQLGYMDWKLQLRPNEEKDMKSQLERERMRIENARLLKDLGYEPILVEGLDGIEFRFKKTATQISSSQGVNIKSVRQMLREGSSQNEINEVEGSPEGRGKRAINQNYQSMPEKAIRKDYTTNKVKVRVIRADGVQQSYYVARDKLKSFIAQHEAKGQKVVVEGIGELTENNYGAEIILEVADKINDLMQKNKFDEIGELLFKRGVDEQTAWGIALFGYILKNKHDIANALIGDYHGKPIEKIDNFANIRGLISDDIIEMWLKGMNELFKQKYGSIILHRKISGKIANRWQTQKQNDAKKYTHDEYIIEMQYGKSDNSIEIQSDNILDFNETHVLIDCTDKTFSIS